MANGTIANYPLSGPVNQAFDFFNSWFRAIGSQFGLVNITVGSTANPDAEKRILEDVGTYGRQLGRIGDALRVLVEQAEKNGQSTGLAEKDKKALRAFLYQTDMVDDIKARYKKPE
jgi:hypothetical protein